ncbi:probable disease resistance protein At4g27220 [Impatiens glandulifera]|uniref:probable disease resistance protein At4g27220 n=1 Tax=Impatiens glandulifera TaxID=253017 RepID=UPI001FB0D683|nr:probable disease resistance protein At4g27220 [Impatiens glandulifera]
MAEEVGLSVAGKIAELLLIEPIQRELGYLFCFNSNFQELEDRLVDLRAKRIDVQAREDAEERKRRTLGKEAENWIKDADGKIVETENLKKKKAELQKGCFSIKWCPNISLRFSLGRKGKKLSLLLIQLLQRADNLPNEGYDLPMQPIQWGNYNGDASDFDSRNKFTKNIIEMLRDQETMLIGICGMGGIGKTTFAKQILQKVSDSPKPLFDFQVISTVSNSPNFNVIQQEVSEMLGTTLEGVHSEFVRAENLRNAFSNKRVVVLLDDVWDEFDLNAFGFPLTKSNVGCCCKIIYTSRNKDLWSGQRTITKKEIELDLLSSEEAFNLFKRKVDLQHDDINFHWKNEKARKIVDECERLPLALGVVGGALIEKDKHEWEHMLNQLRYQGQDQHTYKDKINKVLETSYLHLQDLNAQSLFLLCCLFGEDEMIPIETLYRYALGLQLFKGRNDLRQTRVLVYTLVDNLIRRNLLIKLEALYRGERAVKMHDLVRDVGILIAEKEKKGIHFLKCDGVNQLENIVTPHTKIISILFQKKNDIEVLDSMEFRGSKLELLRWDSSSVFGSNIEISENVLKEANNLKVLNILYNLYKISEFSLSSSLAKLKMLSIEGMNTNMTPNVSSIGHMKCLEVLSFRRSYMKALPNEISELTNLRLLDLSMCKCYISNGTLSKLTNLHELYMWESFQDWRLQKEDVNGGDNHAAAGLDELNFLHKLWRLELEVPNIKQIPRGVKLFSSSKLLEQFKIRIGERDPIKFKSIKFKSGERQLWLENARDNTNFLPELGFLIEKGITDLHVCADSGMWENMCTNKFLFLSLKDIKLKKCGSLFPQSPSLLQTSELGRCLQCIKLYECNKMTHLCSTSISKNLTNLQALVLEGCEMMEEVVSSCNKTEQLNKIEFNALETLKLSDLSRLECFFKGVNEIHFHKLKILELKGLKQFIFPTKLEIPCVEELSMKSIPNIETLCNIFLPSLQKLNIDSCDNFQYVDFFDSLVISNLKSLIIKSCKMLKGVVGVTTGAREQGRKSIEFPNLSTLELEFLDKLSSFVIDVNDLDDKDEKSQSVLFYHDDYQVMLPSLHELKISALPKINYIIGRNSEQVRVHDDIEEWHGRELLVFPNVETLRLKHLKELVSFVGEMNNMENDCKNQNALFHLDDDDEVWFPSLQELCIKGLSKIKYIVGRKSGQVGVHRDHIEEEEGRGRREIQQPILFPNLKLLVLDDLEENVSFVGVMNNNMDNNCKNQNALFHLDDDEVWFPCLKDLNISGLPKINYIVGWKEGEGHHHPPDYNKIFPVLNRLWLSELSNLIHMYEINQSGGLGGVLLFQNLTSLNVGGCGKLRYLFSENIGRVVGKHLEWLYITNCGMMEVVMKNIIEDDDKTERGSNNSVDGNTRHFFPLLSSLRLWNLSGLMSFSDVAYTWELPSLEDLHVSYCPKLEALSPGYLDSPRLNELNYDNYREEVNVKDTWKGDVNKALRHLFIEKKQEEELERRKMEITERMKLKMMEIKMEMETETETKTDDDEL